MAALAVLSVSEEAEAAETGETLPMTADEDGTYYLQGDMTFTEDNRIVVEKGEVLFVDPHDLSLTGTGSAIIELKEGSYMGLSPDYNVLGLDVNEITKDLTISLDGTVSTNFTLEMTTGSFKIGLEADEGTEIVADGNKLTFVKSTVLKIEGSLGGSLFSMDDDFGLSSITLSAEFNGDVRIDVKNVSATVKGTINIEIESSTITGDANFELNVVKTPKEGNDPDYGFDISAKLDVAVNLVMPDGKLGIPTGKIQAKVGVNGSWSDEDGDEFEMKGLSGVIDIEVKDNVLKPEVNLRLDSLQSRGDLDIDVKNVYAKVFSEVNIADLEGLDTSGIDFVDFEESDFEGIFGTLLGMGQDISYSAGVESADVFYNGTKVSVSDTKVEGVLGEGGATIKGNGTLSVDSYTSNESFLIDNAKIDASIDLDEDVADITISSDKVVIVDKGIKASLKGVEFKGDLDSFTVSADEIGIEVKNAENTDIASISGTIHSIKDVKIEDLDRIEIPNITAELHMESPSGDSSLRFDNAGISIVLDGYFTDEEDIQLHSGTMEISTDGSLYLPICIDVGEGATLNVSGDVTLEGLDLEGSGTGVLKLTDYCYVEDGKVLNCSDALLSVDVSDSKLQVVLRDYQNLLKKDDASDVKYVISEDGTYADVIPDDENQLLLITVCVNLKATLDGKEVEILSDKALSIDAGGSKMVTDGLLLYIADEDGRINFLPYKGPNATYEFTKVDVEKTLGDHFASSSPTDYKSVDGFTTIDLETSDGIIYINTPDGVKFQFDSGMAKELTVAVKKLSKEGHYDIVASSIDVTVLIPIEEGQTLYHVTTQGLNPEALEYEIVTVGDETYASFKTDSFSEFYVSDGIADSESSSESGSSDTSMLVGIAAAALVVLLLALVAFRLKSRNSD